LSVEKESSGTSTRRKILILLDALRHTTGGEALYHYLEGLLQDLDRAQIQTEEVYLGLIRGLLDKLSGYLPDDSPLRAQLKLMQLSFTPPMTGPELARLAQRLGDITAGESVSSETSTNRTVEAALRQLVQDVGLGGPAPSPPPPEPPPEQPEATARETQATPPPVEGPAVPLESAQQQQVDNKRLRFQEVQKTLTQQVTEVIKQNEEFGVFLEVELDALRQAGNLQEVDTLRQMLCKEVEKLLQRHRSLAGKLDRSHSYLQIIETDSQLLTDELSRVHLLSLTDELTGLPNRRAFTRRLEDEVARVQRYGYPLSLALMDLDNFKTINDEYGHAAGDEVLRSFSTNILSMFRHHDMVSRYGGEEFAVLLPNTDLEGAMRALRKVQKRATESTYQFNGSTMPLPTFSAGLALYKPGETPGNLIERADNALYRAKRLGRNRIEQGTHEGQDRPPRTDA